MWELLLKVEKSDAVVGLKNWDMGEHKGSAYCCVKYCFIAFNILVWVSGDASIYLSIKENSCMATIESFVIYLNPSFDIILITWKIKIWLVNWFALPRFSNIYNLNFLLLKCQSWGKLKKYDLLLSKEIVMFLE